MEFKYTTDGKKVVIVGNLNSQEKIVQEIFVVNGVEVPSGENFVVKSLHDAPVISWKEKNLKELELRFDKEEREWRDKIDRNRKLYHQQCNLFSEKYQWVAKALKNIDESQFDLLINYITGKITHIVTIEYTPQIVSFDTYLQTYDDKLRLVSIFGKSDGNLSYGVGEYYDYSGSKQGVIPCMSYESALKELRGILDDKSLTKELIEVYKKHKISIPKDKMKEYKDRAIANWKQNIDKYNKEISACQNNIKEINLLK